MSEKDNSHIYYIASGGYRYFVEADNQYDVVQLGKKLFSAPEVGPCQTRVSDNELIRKVGGCWHFPAAYEPLNERERKVTA